MNERGFQLTWYNKVAFQPYAVADDGLTKQDSRVFLSPYEIETEKDVQKQSVFQKEIRSIQVSLAIHISSIPSYPRVGES